jgi:hypothetical protein
MTSAYEYREYAQECVRSAAQAKTEKERKAFLEMASAWTRVALATSDGAKQFACSADNLPVRASKSSQG